VNDDSQLDVWSHNETFTPRRAVVLLGASNLSRAFSTAVSMSRGAFDAPLAFYVAKGHGRSYGKVSSCFWKKNSGIFSCGIWPALAREKNVPISAVLTDIGNDLAYEVPVDQVFEWVEACVDRLLALDAEVVLTDLPMEPLRQVSAAQFGFFRALLFPQCRLSHQEIQHRAEQLSSRLHTLAKSRKISIFSVDNAWYGFDPIHVRRRYFGDLWAQLLHGFATDHEPAPSARCPCATAWYLRSLRPEHWSVFSIPRCAEQPHGRLHDGTTIALY